jgi:hypothetical protein
VDCAGCGAGVGGDFVKQIVFRPDPKDVPEIMRRSDLVVGQPFLELPDRPPAHKVLGMIDGIKVRREVVEMVFNDTILMNFIYREAGHQSRDGDAPGSPMVKIDALARQLYGEFGEWVEKNFGVICMECRCALPGHEVHCGVPDRLKNLSFNKGPKPS